MKNLLVIQSSPRGENSISRKLTRELVEQIRGREALTVVERDLAENPLPHLQQEQITAFYTAPEQRNPALQVAVRLSDEAVDQLLKADIVVISAPVWNFSLPSVLKAWIDHIVRAGRTFSFTAEGLRGMAAGKKVYVVTASGSVLSSGTMDFIEPYLRAVLGFIGITDITFIRAEGVNDPKAKDTAFEKAQKKIVEVLVPA